MSVDIGLFADCHFHAACGGIVIPGQEVCDTCRTEWGQLLRPVNTTPNPAVASCEETVAVQQVERRQQQASGEVPKPGQICWLCEQRRHCVRTAQGWECAECRAVV